MAAGCRNAGQVRPARSLCSLRRTDRGEPPTKTLPTPREGERVRRSSRNASGQCLVPPQWRGCWRGAKPTPPLNAQHSSESGGHPVTSVRVQRSPKDRQAQRRSTPERGAPRLRGRRASLRSKRCSCEAAKDKCSTACATSSRTKKHGAARRGATRQEFLVT